jgi:uncharacterized Zn-finger protein
VIKEFHPLGLPACVDSDNRHLQSTFAIDICASFDIGLETAGVFQSNSTTHTGLNTMAGHSIPHLHNDDGVSVIHLGAREFMCIGAKPPFDHPHVYLDMGSDDEILCPYCSTLFRYKGSLHADQTDPAGCLYNDKDAARAA